MEEPIGQALVDQHYEDPEFKFPLWTLIKKCAEDRNISYAKASEIVAPEYAKTIRYNDEAYAEGLIAAREEEVTKARASFQASQGRGEKPQH